MSDKKPEWMIEEDLPRITCSSYDCKRDLHNFLKRRPKGDETYRSKECVSCGIELIGWERLDKHDISDIIHTCQALKHEMIRHYYWHKSIDNQAINHAIRKGKNKLREAATQRIQKYIAPSRERIFQDGRQTPLSGNMIFYAQHATATCCRRCVEAWHGIERNRELTDEEVSYMVDLIMFYIAERWPNPMAVPSRAVSKSADAS